MILYLFQSILPVISSFSPINSTLIYARWQTLDQAKTFPGPARCATSKLLEEKSDVEGKFIGAMVTTIPKNRKHEQDDTTRVQTVSLDDWLCSTVLHSQNISLLHRRLFSVFAVSPPLQTDQWFVLLYSTSNDGFLDNRT